MVPSGLCKPYIQRDALFKACVVGNPEKWKTIVYEAERHDRSSEGDVSPAELRIGHINNEDDETVLGIVVENMDIGTSLPMLSWLPYIFP